MADSADPNRHSAAFARFSDIRRTAAVDLTLHNLVQVVEQKLDLAARLPVIAYQADADGHAACADLLRRMAEEEERQVLQLLGALRERLDAVLPAA